MEKFVCKINFVYHKGVYEYQISQVQSLQVSNGRVWVRLSF